MIASEFLRKTEFSSYEDFVRNYYLTYPDNFNFATHVVDAYALKEPRRTALVWCDDEGREKVMSFKEMSELSKRIAAYLRKIGVRKGDRVMMILKRRWEYWPTVVALHRIGAIAIPASFQLRDKDIAYRVNAANVKLIIAADDDFIINQVELARPDCHCLEKTALIRRRRDGWLEFTRGVDNTKEEFTVDETLSFDDHMLLYFTSGTDGYPKMVVHSYTYPLGHIATAGYWQCVEDGGLHFTGVDSGWAKFGWGLIYGQWLCGSAVLGFDDNGKFDPRNLINVIRKYRPTTLCVPGTIYRFMIREGLQREDFASVHHCCTAGEPLTPAIIEEFKDITGLDIFEGYGQSESSVLVANYPWFKPKLGSMGRPSPLYDLVLEDERGRVCPPGVEGEIVVRSLQYGLPEGLIQGYFRNGRVENAYGERFVYHTGDIAYRDEEGYFWFVGRNDDVVKCSGYRIGPFEIESVLNAHPAVLECAVTGAPDPIRGQVVKATIVLSKGVAPSEELTKELQEHVKKETAPYKYPRIVEYVESLPKTNSGKIIRKALRINDL